MLVFQGMAMQSICLIHSVSLGGDSWQSDWTRAEHGLLGPGIEGAELIYRKRT